MAVKKDRSTFVVIILTYVVIVIIFTVLMAGLFLYSAETITKQMRQMDGFIAERTVQQVNDMLTGLYDQGEMLVQDERLMIFSGLSPDIQKATGAEVGKIIDRANNFTGLTTDLFFCPSGPDIILDKTGFHEGEDLETLLQETLGISVDEWRERASFAGGRSFQIVAASDRQGVRHRYFLMMVRVPGKGDAEQECFVAGIVPIELLSDVSSAIRPEGYEDIIAEYPDGVYSFRRQELISREELQESKQGSTDIFSLLFSEKPIHITSSEGNVGDFKWQIHFFCQMTPYRSTVLVCLRNFIVSVLIVLVLGSVLLYLILSNQYRPLKILMDRVSGRRRDGGAALRGEYRMIDQAIGALQERQKGTENRLAEYRTRLQKSAVHQLLRGDGNREQSLTEFFAQQELDLHAEQCRVMLLALDADEIMGGLEEDKADTLLKSLLEDMESFIYQCLPNSCCAIADDCVECLICSDNEKSDAEVLHFVKDSLTDYCRENNLHFYAAISKADTGTEGAHRAFLQAETILDHMTMTGYRDVILDELPEQQYSKAKAGQDTRQQQLLEYVNEHYADASLSVLQMADVFDMSPSSVSRTFKQGTETGLNTYIHSLRIAKAKELMENTHDSLKHISEEVGYGNQITMIRAFKKLEGITPREYRDQKQNRIKTDSSENSEKTEKL